jgi:hypothetical protein
MDVTKDCSFSLIQLNHYSADLTLHFEALPPGVYFVLVRLGSVTQTVPIVIE